MASIHHDEYEFNLELANSFPALSYYEIDDDGKKQLRFHPPVYQARYSTINSILTTKQWIPHIKKVAFGPTTDAYRHKCLPNENNIAPDRLLNLVALT